MHIIQEYVKDSTKPWMASTKWLTPDGRVCTTCGGSDRSFAEAIGNMIVQLSACKDHPLTLSFIDEEGNKATQRKM
jgi:hypothetical protein